MMDAQRSPISRCPVCSSKLFLSVGSPSICLFSLVPVDPTSATTSHISEITQDCRKKRKNVHAQGESYKHASTISMLPDDVLLEIFDFYHDHDRHLVWKWHLLVHVCQKWRQIVFASPHRLNLQILCTNKTPVGKLSTWPALPIVIDYHYSKISIEPRREDSVMTALTYPDRVCNVGLDITGSQLGKMAKVMKMPFPVLTRLFIISKDGNAPVLPATFLGGSAPRLQNVTLSGIPYPTLPTLLLSATGLVTLELRNIPPTGYLSPEALVVGLAALLGLKTLHIKFRSATSRPDQIRPPPVTRAILPGLTSFEFEGASEYLEDLVARIHSPQLDSIYANFFNQLVDFQVAQLSKFINRSVGPKLALFRHAEVAFGSSLVFFTIYSYPRTNPSNWSWHPGGTLARTIISCEGIDWQVSHMAQVLGQFSETISTVVHLKLDGWFKKDVQLDGTDDVEWMHFFHQFSTVRTLYVSHRFAGHVALVLEDITTEMIAEVLPSLDLIYLQEWPASSIEKFVAARWLSGRPVTVISTEAEFEKRVESYDR